MAGLSNDPARCEVMNLGWAAGGHGPYLVRQEGRVPGSSDLRQGHFILQQDGRWLLNLLFAMLPEVEQEKQLFHSLAEVAVRLDRLSSEPLAVDATLPVGVDVDDLWRKFETCTHRILTGMRSCGTKG